MRFGPGGCDCCGELCCGYYGNVDAVASPLSRIWTPVGLGMENFTATYPYLSGAWPQVRVNNLENVHPVFSLFTISGPGWVSPPRDYAFATAYEQLGMTSVAKDRAWLVTQASTCATITYFIIAGKRPRFLITAGGTNFAPAAKMRPQSAQTPYPSYTDWRHDTPFATDGIGQVLQWFLLFGAAGGPAGGPWLSLRSSVTGLATGSHTSYHATTGFAMDGENGPYTHTLLTPAEGGTAYPAGLTASVKIIFDGWPKQVAPNEAKDAVLGWKHYGGNGGGNTTQLNQVSGNILTCDPFFMRAQLTFPVAATVYTGTGSAPAAFDTPPMFASVPCC